MHVNRRIMVVSSTMTTLIFVHTSPVTHSPRHSAIIPWHSHGSKTKEEGLSQYCTFLFKYHCSSSLVPPLLTPLTTDSDISHHCWYLLARLPRLPSGCILLPKSHLNQEMWGSSECQGSDTGGQSRACSPSCRKGIKSGQHGWLGLTNQTQSTVKLASHDTDTQQPGAFERIRRLTVTNTGKVLKQQLNSETILPVNRTLAPPLRNVEPKLADLLTSIVS